MIEATALKRGTTFMLDGNPFQVVSYSHSKIGRGGATVKIKAKNLETGALLDKTLNSNAKIEEVSTRKKVMQYLYLNDDSAVFMDPVTYEQIEISANVIGPTISFLKEATEVNVLFYDDPVNAKSRPLSVEMAPKVTLRVKSAAPGIKGNSASNIYKPAVLENGLSLKVPLFIKRGDKIRVDTRTGEYVERENF